LNCSSSSVSQQHPSSAKKTIERVEEGRREEKEEREERRNRKERSLDFSHFAVSFSFQFLPNPRGKNETY